MALGRLYQDNEIAAMTGCGVSLWTLYRPFLLLGTALAVLTALLAFQIGPWAGRTSDYLVKDAARFIKYNPFEEGRFKSIGDDRRSEEHTSELQSLMRKSYAVFCL